ncbi:hypothetical protein [Hymenobacter algoricola]|uniref:Uncharacterized protein n=1 Tax=Hymenobacter algoricola TaxID=486267 RepID=A0ABP7MEQ9_9BACT
MPASFGQRNPAPAADHDGMPAAWEVRRRLSPQDAADRSKRTTGGYTVLELQLGSLAEMPVND